MNNSMIIAAGERKDDDEGTGLGVATRTRTRTKTPSPYKVLMLNDDYTPMEFVVLVLHKIFKMDIEDATRVMLHVHQRGVGVCGIFSYEVAETKVTQVTDFARENQHPLQCTLEKACRPSAQAAANRCRCGTGSRNWPRLPAAARRAGGNCCPAAR